MPPLPARPQPPRSREQFLDARAPAAPAPPRRRSPGDAGARVSLGLRGTMASGVRRSGGRNMGWPPHRLPLHPGSNRASVHARAHAPPAQSPSTHLACTRHQAATQALPPSPAARSITRGCSSEPHPSSARCTTAAREQAAHEPCAVHCFPTPQRVAIRTPFRAPEARVRPSPAPSLAGRRPRRRRTGRSRCVCHATASVHAQWCVGCAPSDGSSA